MELAIVQNYYYVLDDVVFIYFLFPKLYYSIVCVLKKKCTGIYCYTTM